MYVMIFLTFSRLSAYSQRHEPVKYLKNKFINYRGDQHCCFLSTRYQKFIQWTDKLVDASGKTKVLYSTSGSCRSALLTTIRLVDIKSRNLLRSAYLSALSPIPQTF